MPETLIDISPAIVVIVPVVIGLSQVVKQFVAESMLRFVPLFVLAVSVGGAFLVTDTTWQSTVIQGLAVGLMSIGAFSGSRAVAQG